MLQKFVLLALFQGLPSQKFHKDYAQLPDLKVPVVYKAGVDDRNEIHDQKEELQLYFHQSWIKYDLTSYHENDILPPQHLYSFQNLQGGFRAFLVGNSALRYDKNDQLHRDKQP